MKHLNHKPAASLTALLLALLLLLSGCSEEAASAPQTTAYSAAQNAVTEEAEETAAPEASVSGGAEESGVITLENLPEYSGSPYVEINGNQPVFAADLFTTESSEYYNDLDQIGRCGACFANLGQDLMPTESRGDISSVHPSGWAQADYDFVDGGKLYNRCHLIGFQLAGENANACNLITGTRYLNTEGMLPFEDEVAEYIKSTGNHVLYRVTPDFRDSELVARGVQMEAMSVEDDGAGVCFNVYCYNVQPGVIIDYATGESQLDPDYDEDAAASASSSSSSGASAGAADAEDSGEVMDYVLNTNTMKFHLPTCGSAEDMNPANREDYTGTRQSLIDQGYEPCGRCKP